MTNAIEVSNLSKRYRKGRGLTNLRELLTFGGRNEEEQYHWAIRDVSFYVKPGEALGIIGPNGAGKTTILKLLSNVTKPTGGNIRINGRFSALIELGAGFHPELTGRENVYLNGAILGLKRDELRRRFDEIVQFADIGDFLDTPVKRYSSGMYARLGFAIAVHVDPEVLLVDEVLAVGDTAFQLKCFQRMEALRSTGTSLVFVSHNMQAVQEVCDRAIVLHGGEIAFDGNSAEAVAEYANVLRSRASLSARHSSGETGALKQQLMTHGAKIESVRLLSSTGDPTKILESGEPARIQVTVEFLEDAPAPVFACTIRNERGDIVYDTTSKLQKVDVPNFHAGDRVVVQYDLSTNLLNGTYRLTTDLAYADLSCYYDIIPDAVVFVVDGDSKAKGLAQLNATITFMNGQTSLVGN